MTNLILDCTLRDGAHVNNGLFGKEVANSIVESLVNSGINMIELGFLEPSSANPGTTFFESFDQCAEFFSLSGYGKKVNYGLMLRTDRCPIDAIKINPFIDFIRIAFYPNQLEDAKCYLKLAKEHGYKTYANLISVTSYSEVELRKILREFESVTVDGVSIVDTYGVLDSSSLSPLIAIFNECIGENVALGLHLHENLSGSIDMIATFHEKKINRTRIYDGALGGMGRIPGNIQTELIANYLNNFSGASFNTDLLIRSAAKNVFPFKKVNTWGYLPIYAYSAIKKIDRTYAEYFEACGLSDGDNMTCQDKVCSQVSEPRFDRGLADNILETLGFKVDSKGKFSI